MVGGGREGIAWEDLQLLLLWIGFGRAWPRYRAEDGHQRGHGEGGVPDGCKLDLRLKGLTE